MPNLFIVEDHQIVRKTLVALLKREPDFVIVGEAGSGNEALTLLSDVEVDVLLVDISMPEMDGITLLQEVKKQWPNMICLVLSGHTESVYGMQARAAGAWDYIDKREVKEIVPAIRRALSGVAAGDGE